MELEKVQKKDRPAALNYRQERFISEYLKDFNGTQAAIRAGYSRKGADVVGSRLLANIRVSEALQGYAARSLARLDATREKVLERLALCAFPDIRRLHDENGDLLPVSQWPDEASAWVAGFEVIIKNAKAGDGATDLIHKVKMIDQLKALEMLAKHFGLLIERVEHSGGIEIAWLD